MALNPQEFRIHFSACMITFYNFKSELECRSWGLRLKWKKKNKASYIKIKEKWKQHHYTKTSGFRTHEETSNAIPNKVIIKSPDNLKTDTQEASSHRDMALEKKALHHIVCLVGYLTSSSTTRLYHGHVPRLAFDNFTCCHTRDTGGRPWLLSQLVTLYWHRPNQ